MKARRRCNCRSAKLTADTWRLLLFDAMVAANQTGKTHHVVRRSGELVIVRDVVASEMNYDIFATAAPGLKFINDVHVSKVPDL